LSTIIDLRRRIQSVRNSQQVTQAMKTVATSRYRRAQRQVVARRPFWHTLPELVISLTQEMSLKEHPYLLVRPEKKVVAVIITSDKGLCGAFNSNLLTTAASFLSEKRKIVNWPSSLSARRRLTSPGICPGQWWLPTLTVWRKRSRLSAGV